MPKKDFSAQSAYHERNPWVRHVCWARRRCTSDDPRWKPHYKDQGVLMLVTAAIAEYLWFRDGADKMKRPSLDRIETGPGQHYTLSNCRFIEWIDNVLRPHRELEPEEAA